MKVVIGFISLSTNNSNLIANTNIFKNSKIDDMQGAVNNYFYNYSYCAIKCYSSLFGEFSAKVFGRYSR